MKKSGNLIVLLFAVVFLYPVAFKAQGPAVTSASISRPVISSGWQPVSLNPLNKNVQDGVEFYSRPAECGSQKSDFVKLVNKNSYAVKVAFQMDPSMPVQYVRVPAAGNVEGVCSSADANAAKLVLQFPNNKTEDEIKKMKQYLTSSIVVSKL